MKGNRKAALVAIMPALMIPVERGLQAHHAPDFVVGSFVGVTIGAMILLLIAAVRDRRRTSFGCRRDLR